MKKLLAIVLALCMLLAVVSCTKTEKPVESDPQADTTPVESEDTEADTAEAVDVDPAIPEDPETDAPAEDVKGEGVMTYAEYAAAELDTAVTVETYVQAKQSWWDNKATVYTQDNDGAYFLYNMACSEEDYAKLVPGTKIKVSGFKSEWSGEVEITDATFEIEDGNFVAEALDVTALLGTEELIQNQNKFVAFKGMTVVPSTDADGNEAAFLYNWDGSGEDGNDLYFNVSLNDATYTFTVESYLCDNTTDVYAAVKALQVGDVIDMEGFLYWYNGVNPHITAVTAAE